MPQKIGYEKISVKPSQHPMGAPLEFKKRPVYYRFSSSPLAGGMLQMHLAKILLSMALLVIVSLPACQSSDSGDKSPTEDTAANAPQPVADIQPTAAEGSAASGTRRVFVANYGSDTISVVEGEPHEVEVKVLDGFDSPQRLALRPTRPVYLAVANGTSFAVTFIDPMSFETVASVDLGEAATDIAFSPDGKTLYVVHHAPGQLAFVDVETFTPSGKPVEFGPRRTRRVAASADGTRIFVQLGRDEDAEIAVVDAKSREVAGERIPVDIAPSAMSLGYNGRYLVSASFNEDTLTVIDTATLEVLAKHPAVTGSGLSIHPHKPLAYSMASFDDEFHVVDLDSGELLQTLSPGRSPADGAFTADGRYIYITHEESDSLVKVDTETHQVVGKIVVGKGPVAAAVYEP